MPAVYVSGTFVGVVELQDKDYPYSDWTNIELAKEREGYDRPNLALWLRYPTRKNLFLHFQSRSRIEMFMMGK